MPIFKTVLCTQNKASVEWWPRNASNFTRSHLDIKHFPGGETPGLLLTGAGKRKGEDGKGLKGSHI